ATGEPRACLEGHTAAVVTLALAPDARSLVSADDAGVVTWWDLTTNKEERRWKKEAGKVAWLAFAPDGRTVAVGSSDRTVQLWQGAADEAPVALPLGHEESLRFVAFSPDGGALVSVSGEGRVVHWDRATGRKLLERRLPGSVYAAALASDGRH